MAEHGIDETAGSVLIVTADQRLRDRLASRLEWDGFQVMVCPGPTSLNESCLGDRTGTCPLARGAGVVVLDGALDSIELLEGPASQELVRLYLAHGCDVVRLRHMGEEPMDEPRRVGRSSSSTAMRVSELVRAHLAPTEPALDVEVF